MLICPHCDKPLGPEHDDKGCRRRISRRFFFGLALAPLVVQVAQALPALPIPEPVSITNTAKYNLLTRVWTYTAQLELRPYLFQK